jgi:hypothetical protein
MAKDSRRTATSKRRAGVSKFATTLGAEPKPGTYGAATSMRMQTKGKRPRGKPPAADRVRRDRIVGYLLYLQRTKPGGNLTRDFVPAAATFFGCDVKTVWKAWREYKSGAPLDVGYVGPMHWTSTSGARGTY